MSFENQWYEAELARSGRSKCKEFRCKQNIGQGELRIGIKIEENDHSGDTLGWYHPACLWKTFTYKSNGNPRIENTDDIRNFEALSVGNKKIISDLLNGSKSQSASVSISSPLSGVKHGRDETLASTCDGSATNEALPVVPVVSEKKPPYAMCGTIILTINKINQDIVIRGDTNHIRYRLLGVSGSHHAVGPYPYDHWVFPTESRPQARPFFCYPDALPAAGVDVILDLSELGRKQALAAGVEITPQEQQIANDMLIAEHARRDAKIIETARLKLMSIGWLKGGGTEEGGRAKRGKKNEDVPPQPTRVLPTTIDELCYELRLDLTRLTIPEFKERLKARGNGLKVTGNRDALEARLVLAGVELQPIENIAEYTQLARKRVKQFQGAVVGQEQECIDMLLARCV